MDNCIRVRDFEIMAAKLLPKGLLNFVGFGETDSRTLVKKLSGFDSWRFQQRVLRDVSRVDTGSSMLGSNISFPVCVAPFGLQKMPSQRGEIDSAKAAENAGTGFAMSFWSSCTIEEVAKAVPNVLRWFQLYITKDRLVSKNLVQRAKRNGYSAIIVTVDYVVQGKEYVNLYNDIAASPSLATKSIEENFYKGIFEGMDVYDLSMDQSITWKDIDWVRSISDLPIIIKGIATVEMALKAVEHGVEAIVVSNHGGRSLHSTIPAIHVLPKIAKAVNGRCEIYFDSGIRNGGDVAKAICLGANAVFVGRPIIWGLACGGKEGAQKVLEILRDEFELTMKLLGVTSIKELQSVPDLVVHESNILSRL